MAGEENVFQLAFIDLLFASSGVFLNVIVGFFQTLLTQVFQGFFGAVTGTTA